MTAERIIAEILSRHPEISREQIAERLRMEKIKTGGFISDETLLRLIATEFGVEIPHNASLTSALSLGDLVPGLTDVTVVGRVVALFSSKTFARKKSGRFASLFVVDKSDIMRVVLWNDKASLIESGAVKVGQMVRLSHTYTREDRSGKVELHIGERGEIEVNPRNIQAKEYPTISKFTTMIGEITKALTNKKVNAVGNVKELFSASTFKRQDSSSGKVLRFTLVDQTGEMTVVVWNEKVDELEEILKKEVRVQIVNGKVKKGLGDSLEIHVDNGTYVASFAPENELSKIADLKEGQNHANVEGEIITKPVLRDVKTSKGETVKLAVFELMDETSRIWVSAWRKHANIAANLKLGDNVTIRKAYVKRGFGDQLELSTRSTTSIVRSENREEQP